MAILKEETQAYTDLEPEVENKSNNSLLLTNSTKEKEKPERKDFKYYLSFFEYVPIIDSLPAIIPLKILAQLFYNEIQSDIAWKEESQSSSSLSVTTTTESISTTPEEG